MLARRRMPARAPRACCRRSRGPDAGRRRSRYALDGGVFTAGALLEWLAGGLGLAADPPPLAALAAEVPDSAGVMVLPGARRARLAVVGAAARAA